MRRFDFIEPELEIPEKTRESPASYLRKEFFVEKEPEKATIVATALGVYKLFVNGREIDERMLAPGFTNYHKRVQYQEYDVADMLHEGINTIGVILGDGWYRGCLGIQSSRCFYGDKIKFAAILEMKLGNCSQTVVTDKTWKATQDGPIFCNDLKTYEKYDARKEMAGWADAGYDDRNWHCCMRGNYSGAVILQEGEDVIEHEVFSPAILRTPNGNTVLDFGQNHAGHVEFTVTGKEGTEISLSMGETLDENGNFTTKNLQKEEPESYSGKLGQTLVYILKEGKQTYKSRFLYSGYRYVKLKGWPEKPEASNFKSIAVYSNLKQTGTFHCSNEKINQLVRNVRWSQKSNFVDIPTDCPTRERSGWTGDINVFSETACYFTDTRKFLKKWIRDFIGLQDQDGGLPFIVPETPFNFAPFMDMQKMSYSSAGWADGLANISMVLYQFYGEKEILEEVYEPLKKFVEMNLKRAEKRNFAHLFKRGKHYRYILDTGFHYGEWLEPGSVMSRDAIKAFFLPDEEVATAWMYHTILQLTEMAGLLGRPSDQAHYGKMASVVKSAYQKEFISDGLVHSKRQCRYVRPLQMGLVPKDNAAAVAEVLNQKCMDNHYKLGTGFLTTYKLLSVLCDYGYVDTAYRILENEECPGWFYEINRGATTIWENWLGVGPDDVPVDSHNHYAPGAVVAWLFQYCAGIKPLRPGFETTVIKPYIGGGLSHVEATYDSIRGRIVSAWKIEKNQFSLHVEVPDGMDVKVILPDGAESEMTGGSKEYSCLI